MEQTYPPGSIVVDGVWRSKPVELRRCASCGRFVGYRVEVWGQKEQFAVCNIQCGINLIVKRGDYEIAV